MVWVFSKRREGGSVGRRIELGFSYFLEYFFGYDVFGVRIIIVSVDRKVVMRSVLV